MFDDADVLEAVNVEHFPDGEEVAPFAIFGNSVTYGDEEGGSGMIVAARAMQQVRSIFSFCWGDRFRFGRSVFFSLPRSRSGRQACIGDLWWLVHLFPPRR